MLPRSEMVSSTGNMGLPVERQALKIVLILKPEFAEKAKEKQILEGKMLGGNPTLSEISTKGSIDTRKQIESGGAVLQKSVKPVIKTDKELVENFPQVKGRKTRQITAEKAGFGNETTYK